MPYGIILLPDTRTSARLVAYARSIAHDVPTIMCVDEVRRPHLTLLHVDCGRAEAAELWGRTCATVPAELPVVLSGTQIAAFATGDPYVPQGGVYVGSEALRSADLDAAHREVLGHARELSLGTLTSAGADYRPHVTLAVLETSDHVLVPVPPQELSVPFTGRLAWGAMGPYGTFPDIIEIRNTAAT
ncbi:hypothetical protein ACIRL2_37850 [Embleya sp. NPDC127516]|uniref:hypothetical protein n=1 Tax=Embleya sp. NPDC127516 TaxID=3363990 RepID=UPI003822EDC9